MNVLRSSEVPKYLRADETLTYPVGSQVIIKANHMPGMKGATATIVGANKTTEYKVTYIPKTVGHPVKHYKWVIHEEIGKSVMPELLHLNLVIMFYNMLIMWKERIE
jgi:hypothetical protein